MQGKVVHLAVGKHRVEDDHLALLRENGQPFRAVEVVPRLRASVWVFCSLRPGKVGLTAGSDVVEVKEDSRETIHGAILDRCDHFRIVRIRLRVKEVVVGRVVLLVLILEDLDVLGVGNGNAGEHHHAPIDGLEESVAHCGQEVLRRRAELLRRLAFVRILKSHARLGHVRHCSANDVLVLAWGEEVLYTHHEWLERDGHDFRHLSWNQARQRVNVAHVHRRPNPLSPLHQKQPALLQRPLDALDTNALVVEEGR
mmetsp:Transcript_21000/g.44625  ORF Transcript_21000/g.44625 Transcript_21000/m.44625 type:complete len:255 (+) Transcript_21000:440-1204(+)